MANLPTEEEAKALYEEVTHPKSRTEATAYCSGCHASGVKAMQCSRCKQSWYCSKECQKKDWPVHKFICSKKDFDMAKCIDRLRATDLLSGQMVLALALLFDLPSGKISPSTPLLAKVVVGFEPKMQTLVEMRHGKPPPAGDIPGHFTINQMEVGDVKEMAQDRIAMWKYLRDWFDARGETSSYVIVVSCEYLNGVPLSSPWPVIPHAIEAAKERKPFTRTGGTPDAPSTRLVPMNLKTAIENINMDIRHDVANRMKMRKTLSKGDMDVLQDAFKGRNLQSRSVQAFKAKMEREDVYKNSYVVLT